MGPKTQTNTCEITEFSLGLTIVYLAMRASDTDSVTEWIFNLLTENGLSVSVCVHC